MAKLSMFTVTPGEDLSLLVQAEGVLPAAGHLYDSDFQIDRLNQLGAVDIFGGTLT